jgi:hypothetical protein
MPRPNITRFANLAIDPSLDPGNPYKLFRLPHVTTDEKNNIPSDGIKGGELIYNSSENLVELYGNNEFNTLPFFRRGKVNLGDVGNNGRPVGVLPAASYNGFITGAEFLSRVDAERDVFRIDYENKGYVPFPVFSINNTGANADTKPITSINVFEVTDSSLKFIIGEVTAGTSDIVILDVLLLSFPALADPANPDD